MKKFISPLINADLPGLAQTGGAGDCSWFSV